MRTLFRLHLFDIYVDVYKNEKHFATITVQPSVACKTVVCTVCPEGFTAYNYANFLKVIGFPPDPNIVSVKDYRTSIK